MLLRAQTVLTSNTVYFCIDSIFVQLAPKSEIQKRWQKESSPRYDSEMDAKQMQQGKVHDKRFVRPNGEAIERLSKQNGLSLRTLAKKAKVSYDSVKRMVKNEPKQPRIIANVAGVLGVDPIHILQGYDAELVPGREYSWTDILHGAKNVANELFKDSKFCADGIHCHFRQSKLSTSEAPSQIFLQDQSGNIQCVSAARNC
jgi:lambda repressor-like predicted transcriptional regulator